MLQKLIQRILPSKPVPNVFLQKLGEPEVFIKASLRGGECNVRLYGTASYGKHADGTVCAATITRDVEVLPELQKALQTLLNVHGPGVSTAAGVAAAEALVVASSKGEIA